MVLNAAYWVMFVTIQFRNQYNFMPLPYHYLFGCVSQQNIPWHTAHALLHCAAFIRTGLATDLCGRGIFGVGGYQLSKQLQLVPPLDRHVVSNGYQWMPTDVET